MPRLPLAVVASIVALLATAASASAYTFTVTAQPVRPGGFDETNQVLTVSSDSTDGSISMYSFDLATPCPSAADYRAAAEQGVGNGAMGGYDGVNIVLSQPGRTAQAQFDPDKGPGYSHVCSYLDTPPPANGPNDSRYAQTWGPVDTPLKSYGDINGYNLFAKVFFRGSYVQYQVVCVDGTALGSDSPCHVAGHISVTVSKATAKRIGLRGTTLFEAAYDRVQTAEFVVRKNLTRNAIKAIDAGYGSKKGLPATLTVRETAPIAKTLSVRANAARQTLKLATAKIGGGEPAR